MKRHTDKKKTDLPTNQTQHNFCYTTQKVKQSNTKRQYVNKYELSKTLDTKTNTNKNIKGNPKQNIKSKTKQKIN